MNIYNNGLNYPHVVMPANTEENQASEVGATEFVETFHEPLQKQQLQTDIFAASVPNFDNSYEILQLIQALNSGTISLKSLFSEKKMELLLQKNLHLTLSLIGYLSKKIIDIQPSMFPKILDILETAALSIFSPAKDYENLYYLFLGDTHKIIHLMFTKSEGEFFCYFISWWQGVLKRNDCVAITMFRNYGYTYFIPHIKNPVDEDSLKAVLMCLHYTANSVLSYCQEGSNKSFADSNNALVVHHEELFDVLMEFSNQKDLSLEYCYILFLVLKRPAILDSKSQSRYNKFLKNVCSIISKKEESLLCQFVCLEFLSVVESPDKLSKEMKGIVNRFMKMEKNSDFISAYQAHKKEEWVDSLLSEKIFAVELKTILEGPNKRKSLSLKEYVFLYRAVFNTPTFLRIWLPQNADFSVLLPFLQEETTFDSTLEMFAIFAKFYDKKKPYFSEKIEKYLPLETMKKVLNGSLAVSNLAWCGCLFLGSFSSKVPELMKLQGYDFAAFHNIKVAVEKKLLPHISSVAKEKNRKGHEEAFWSVNLRAKNPLRSSFLVNFFIPNLPLTEIFTVMEDIKSLELIKNLPIELRNLCTRLKVLHNVDSDKLDTFFSFKPMLFFFQKEVVVSSINKDQEKNSFSIDYDRQKLTMPRLTMENACFSLVREQSISSTKSSLGLFKTIYFLLCTGTYQEQRNFVEKMFCSEVSLPQIFMKELFLLSHMDEQEKEETFKLVTATADYACKMASDIPSEKRKVNWWGVLDDENSEENLFFLCKIALTLSSDETTRVEILGNERKFIDAFASCNADASCFKSFNKLHNLIPHTILWKAAEKILSGKERKNLLLIRYNKSYADDCLKFLLSLPRDFFVENCTESYITFLLNLLVEKINVFDTFSELLDDVSSEVILNAVVKQCKQAPYNTDAVVPLLTYCYAKAEIESFEIKIDLPSLVKNAPVAIQWQEVLHFYHLIQKRTAKNDLKMAKHALVQENFTFKERTKEVEKRLIFASQNFLKTLGEEKEIFSNILLANSFNEVCFSFNDKAQAILKNIHSFEKENSFKHQAALKALKKHSKLLDNNDEEILHNGVKEICLRIKETVNTHHFFVFIEEEIRNISLQAKQQMRLIAFKHYKEVSNQKSLEKKQKAFSYASKIKIEAEKLLNNLQDLEENFEEFNKQADNSELFDVYRSKNKIETMMRNFTLQVQDVIEEPSSFTEKMEALKTRNQEIAVKLKVATKEKKILEEKIKYQEEKAQPSLQTSILSLSPIQDEAWNSLIQNILGKKNVLGRFKFLDPIESWTKEQKNEWKILTSNLEKIEKKIDLNSSRNLEVTKLSKIMALFGFGVTSNEGSHFKISHPVFYDVNETLVFHSNKQVAPQLVKSCYIKMDSILEKWIQLWIKP